MKLPVDYDKTHFRQRKLVREEYVRLQEGKCWHCLESLSEAPSKASRKMKVNPKFFPANFFKWPVHLHHDRKTGLTIGAVHNHCNAVLWQYFGE